MTAPGDPAALDAAIAEVERFLALPDQPKNLRAEATRLLAWLDDIRAAEPENRAELLADHEHWHPAWSRAPGLVERLTASGALVDDGSGVVAVRWDLIPAEDRRATYSLLNEAVDGYRNRSVGGRPRK